MPPLLTVIVPTFNERENVRPLVAEIGAAVAALDWEVLFVDDSTDGTDAEVRQVAEGEPRVRLLHRERNIGGLAGAVQEGFRAARGQYLCVLDGDLQHPPAGIPALLAEAERSGADLVIASRYIPGGSPGGLDGGLRRFYSRALKMLAKLLFPRRLRGVSDPLGGFFLVRRQVVAEARLRPVGYKILLEVLVRCRPRCVRETPYRFRPRRHGATKADFRQGLRFLRHLARLVHDCSPIAAPLRRQRSVLNDA